MRGCPDGPVPGEEMTRGLSEGGHFEVEQKRDPRGNKWKEDRGMGVEWREEEEALVLVQILPFEGE